MCVTASVHLGWDGNWNRRRIEAVTLNIPQTIKWQAALLGSCHLWSGCSSRAYVSSWNEGCHLQWLYCLLLSRSQWHLSKYRVRRWTWCSPRYKYLGLHNNNRLDRTNKKLYKRWQDIVLQNSHFYQWWPAYRSLQGCVMETTAQWRMQSESLANFNKKIK